MHPSEANNNWNSYALGIDVGGTNTDVVIMQYPAKSVIASSKTTTTKDFSSGIMNAIADVFNKQVEITENYICSLMLGTTTFLNAILQISLDLIPVTVIRLCGPTSQGYPSFINFPENLSNAIKGPCFMIDGGFEYDGKEITPLDERKLADIASQLASSNDPSGSYLSIVITGIFSPSYFSQELRAAEIIHEKFSALNFSKYYITLSHQVGQLGLLEREGAAILNATLKHFAQKTVKNLKSDLKDLNLINCQDSIYFTQNDGTLISCEKASEFPVFTFNSGPTNSLRGACQLSRYQDAIVADIGGTSTDIAVLQNSQPRPAQSYVNIGGVRTNYRMPDIVSIALGGGSLIKFDLKDSNVCTIGPKSIGYKINESVSFGGEYLTATDVAVANQSIVIEGANPALVSIPKKQLDMATNEIIAKLERVVDSMKTSADPMPLILVGGGSVLIPEGLKLEGIFEIIRPKHFDVANAVGAAVAQVSAISEDVIDFGKPSCDTNLENLQLQARQLAIARGAIDNTIDIVTDQAHVAYTPGRIMRVTCRAVGDMDISKPECQMVALEKESMLKHISLRHLDVEPFIENVSGPDSELDGIQAIPETPNFISNENRKEWLLSEDDLSCLAIGAGILGAGGGGSPYIGTLEVRKQLRDGKPVRLINPDDLNKNETAICNAYWAAPLMFIEKLGGAFKIAQATKTLEALTRTPGKKLGAVSGLEMGGANSLAALFVGAELGLPVLDCDFMGRAFPEIQMITPVIYNEALLPLCMRDEKQNEIIVSSVQENDGKKAEGILRRNLMQWGCEVGLAGPHLTSDTVRRVGIKHTVSQIWKLGRDILKARKYKLSPLSVIEKTQGGSLLFTGKIINVLRFTEGGYTKGKMKISGFDSFRNQTLLIDFQNENLIAQSFYGNQENEQKLLAVVPDLISLVDTDTYQPIQTEDLKYGLRVAVLFIPASPLLKTEEALRNVGPKAFGYHDIEYKPVGKYVPPTSVFE